LEPCFDSIVAGVGTVFVAGVGAVFASGVGTVFVAGVGAVFVAGIGDPGYSSFLKPIFQSQAIMSVPFDCPWSNIDG
jgi:hypothetical protein